MSARSGYPKPTGRQPARNLLPGRQIKQNYGKLATARGARLENSPGKLACIGKADAVKLLHCIELHKRMRLENPNDQKTLHHAAFCP
jgi:hypothetical protein